MSSAPGISQRLSERRSLLRLARARAALRSRPRRLAYIGALGEANLGDEAMRAVAQTLYPDAALVAVAPDWVERRLAPLGLSGPAFFDGALLGGGTLIAPYWAPFVQGLLDTGVRLWTLGTGVGSSGFDDAPQVPLAPWETLLPRFAGLGLRGPRSLCALEAAGVAGAEVIGDLALCLAAAQPADPATRPRILLNVARGNDPEQAPPPWLVELEEIVRALIADGVEIVPVAMHPIDIAPLHALLNAAGGGGLTVHLPDDADAFFALAAPCHAALAVRLHAAVLATCVGVAPVLLGYRDKCADFMESLGLEESVVDLARYRPGAIRRALDRTLPGATGRRAAILASARERKASVEAYAARLGAAPAR